MTGPKKFYKAIKIQKRTSSGEITCCRMNKRKETKKAHFWEKKRKRSPGRSITRKCLRMKSQILLSLAIGKSGIQTRSLPIQSSLL
jgi:hypothetical protein